jgi:hypothetical protein
MGTLAGARLPPNATALKAYVTGLQGETMPKPKKGSQKIKATKPDLRDLGTLLSYRILQAHDACLATGWADPTVTLINDDVAVAHPVVWYYPFVSHTLDKLSHAACASVPNTGHAEQNLWRNRMQHMAAAWIWARHRSRPEGPVDAKLMAFCVGRLSSALTLLDVDPSGCEPDSSSREWNLTQALSEPVLGVSTKTTNRKRKATTGTGTETTRAPRATKNTCTFAHTFDVVERAVFGGEEMLSLVFRAFAEEPSKEKVAESILSSLISLVEKCYDLTEVEALLTDLPTGKKRKIPKASTAKRKRRKKDDSTAEVRVDCLPTSDGSYGKGITQARADLAGDCLEALQMCVKDPSAASTFLLALLRNAVSVDSIERVVYLGSRIEGIMVRPDRANNPPNADTLKREPNDSGEGSSPWTSREKKLWSSHMTLVLMLGSGGRANSSAPKRYIFGANRLQIFKTIAAQTSTILSGPFSEAGWPIWQPRAHRLLIASNITNELSTPSRENTAPDCYIVAGMIDSISYLLRNILKFVNLPARQDEWTIEEEIPLSLSDARLFLSVVARLSPQEQRSFLASLLKEMDKAVHEFRKSEKLLAFISGDRKASGFLARLIVLATHFALSVMSGKRFQGVIVNVLEKSLSLSAPIPATGWYKAETCFMGVFSDWESSELPEVPTSLWGIEASTGRILQGVLEGFFKIGILTAPQDNCHLLFASWNALGKSPLWTERTPGIQIPSVLPRDPALLLLDLREDICWLHGQLMKLEGSPCGSTLMEAIDSRVSGDSNQSAAKIKDLLTMMVSKATYVVDKICDQYIPNSAEMDFPMASSVHPLLEVVSCYLSFAVSSCTKPHNQFLSTIQAEVSGGKRARGYSSGSDNLDFDVESGDSRGGLEALERLRNGCLAFGAAPVHPDWLDDECRFRDEFSESDIVKIAIQAQSTLRKIVVLAQSQLEVSLRTVFSRTGESSDNVRSDLAFKLCSLHRFLENQPKDSSFSFQEESVKFEIGSASNLSNEVIGFLLMHGLRNSRVRTKKWYPSMVQRVPGKVHKYFRHKVKVDVSTPELRVAGEWEVLAGLALTAFSTPLCPLQDQAHGIEKPVFREIALYEKWHEVGVAALSSLAPVVSLLRMGLQHSGRPTHPFAKTKATFEDLDVHTLCPKSWTLSHSMLDEPQKNSILDTLGVLARLPVNSTWEAVSCQLVLDGPKFRTIQQFEVVRLALAAMSALASAANGNAIDRPDIVRKLMDRVVNILIQHVGHDRAGFFFESIGVKEVDYRTIVGKTSTISKRIDETRSMCCLSKELVDGMFLFFLNETEAVSQEARLSILCLMSSIAQHSLSNDCSTKSKALEVVGLFREAFYAVPESRILSLVTSDICNHSIEGSDTLQSAVSCILAFCLIELEKPGAYAPIIESLKDFVDDSMNKDYRFVSRPLLLLLLCSVQWDCLHDVVGTLLESNASQSRQVIKIVATFLESLNNDRSTVGSSRVKSDANDVTGKPVICSFVAKAGFHDQHWYNCYTCGLTWDKGCCSMCALVCHMGHDVAYSRYSSFFCDCGGNNKREAQRKCRCLTPLPSSEAEAAWAFGNARGGGKGTWTPRSPDLRPYKLDSQIDAQTNRFGEIALQFCPSQVKSALGSIINVGRTRNWGRITLDAVYEEYRIRKDDSSVMLLEENEEEQMNWCQEGGDLLSRRTNTQVVFKTDPSLPFRVARQSESGVFELSKKVDLPLDETGKALRDTKPSVRSALEVDSRGNVVVAATRVLSFWNCVQLLNTRYMHGGTSFSRTSLSIEGSRLVDFDIHGMKLSRPNENFLLIWGLSDVTVYSWKAAVNTCETIFDLSQQKKSLATADDEVVVHCDWLPGSMFAIAIVRSRSINLFHILSHSKMSTPVATISVSQKNASISNCCFIPITHSSDEAHSMSWIIMAILDDGRVCKASVTMNDSASVFSVAPEFDFARYLPVPDREDDTTERGGPAGYRKNMIGRQLDFLPLSRLLLLEIPSVCVMAYAVTEDGQISRGFELVPWEIRGKASVRGPFTRWRDFGRDLKCSSTKFCVGCICESSSSGDPVPLVLGVDGTVTSVATIQGAATLGSNGTSVEGIGLFSVPELIDDCAIYDLRGRRSFRESIIWLILSSNGSLCLLKEDGGWPIATQLNSQNERRTAIQTSTASAHLDLPMKLIASPLLAFEELTNLTDLKVVEFAGFGLEAGDILKSKLTKDNDSVLASPCRDGFTLSLSVRSESSKMLDFARNGGLAGGQECSGRFVVSALRILVGSTSKECIPQTIYVNGRPVDVLSSTRKWYSVVFTSEEIALGLRSGRISIRFSRAFDEGCKPVVDAVEVFGVDYSVVAAWIPTRLQSIATRGISHPASENGSLSGRHEVGSEEEGLLALSSLCSLCSLFRVPKPLGSIDRTYLENFVCLTAFQDDRHNENVDAILSCFEPEGASRRLYRDKGIVAACFERLSDCRLKFDNDEVVTGQSHSVFYRTVSKYLRAALRVARARPVNYLQALDHSLEKKGSVAKYCVKVVPFSMPFGKAQLTMVSNVVELSLLEMVIAISYGEHAESLSINSNGLGKFETLSTILSVRNPVVVEEACKRVSDFCTSHKNSKSGKNDVFAVQTMAVHYGCDCCHDVPIKTVRYSMSTSGSCFDLCRECFDLGSSFALSKDYSSGIDVVVDGKFIGTQSSRLKCSDIKNMERIPIGNRKQDDQDSENHGKTRKFLTGRLERNALFESFVGKLFSGVMTLVSKQSSVGTRAYFRLYQLAIDLIEVCGTAEVRQARAKIFSTSLVEGLAQHWNALVDRYDSDPDRWEFDKHVGHVLLLLLKTCSAGGEKVTSDKNRCVKNHVWTLLVSVKCGQKYSVLTHLHERLRQQKSEANPDCHTFSDGLSKEIDIRQSVARSNHLDGVNCCQQRLLYSSHLQSAFAFSEEHREQAPFDPVRYERSPALIEYVLETISQFGDPSSEESRTWFPFLCELILSQKEDFLKKLSKKCLFALCGDDQELYLSVRDHHSFCYQVSSLASTLEHGLKGCLAVNEKARLCGETRRTNAEASWNSLTMGEIVGTDHLVPESITSSQAVLSAGAILDKIWLIARRRPPSWHRFGRLSSFPATSISNHKFSAFSSFLKEVLSGPPIRVILASMCLLNGQGQLKCLRLFEQLLDRHSPITDTASAPCESVFDLIPCGPHELDSFVFRFVSQSSHSDVRKIGIAIVEKLCSVRNRKEVGALFHRLLCTQVNYTTRVGKDSTEFFLLLQRILKIGLPFYLGIAKSSSLVEDLWLKQVQEIQSESVRAIHECAYFEARLGSPVHRKHFDFSCCLHCDGNNQSASREKRSSKGNGGAISSANGADKLDPIPKGPLASPQPSIISLSQEVKWHPEQVSGFARGRPDCGKSSCVSDEFNSYIRLRYRLALSEVHVEVRDPRGRFVKTIDVFYTPGPVPNIENLKDGTNKWEACAQLHFSRGATSSNCKLPEVVVAANIKIRYSDFYERLGSSKSLDGSLQVHCPRCTRLVTNAHGVCGNCGEVAFQCRKCRHINYERLDAFLCVECGFCASGTFSFEFIAGVASNAVVITNDKELERSNQMYATASELREDITGALKDKLAELLRKKKKNTRPDKEPLFSPELQLAFFSNEAGSRASCKEVEDSVVSLNKLGRQGTVVKAVARSSSLTTTGVFPNQTASLRRLFRSWRPNSSTSRRLPVSEGGGEVLGGDIQIEEDDTEVFGLLEQGSSLSRMAGLDAADPLNRLLASVQSFHDGRASEFDEIYEQNEARGPFKLKSQVRGHSSGELLQLCERLYHLKREAEYEAHRLNEKICAWRRLEMGSLVPKAPANPTSFIPSRCSVCSHSIALHFLILWLNLFEADPSCVIVTHAMIQSLLEEDSGFTKNLRNLKRTVVKEIALRSKVGAALVLKILTRRLAVFEEINCTSILGMIIKEGNEASPYRPDFTKLAVKIVRSS